MLAEPDTLWQRFARMSWEELRVRATQEVCKRWDSHFYRPPARDRDAQSAGRFFFQPDQVPAVVAVLRRRLPQEVDATLRQADRICHHRFDLLGYEDVPCGPEIDWHADPVHGKRAPCQPWYKVPYLDFSQVGDAKIIWELNRHQHLVTLAKAYCFSQESRFCEELVRQWYHWLQENPYPLGINWASTLEVAFRSLSWLWVRHLLAGNADIPQQFWPDLNRQLLVNARHIERYLSTYFSPNTHLLGEAVGLFLIGTLCAGPHTSRWAQAGWATVLQQAQRQVLPDGMHFEQSTYYHVYALDFLLHARLIASKNSLIIPDAYDAILQRMLEVLVNLGQGWAPPRFGDDDGGRLFDGRRNRAPHLLDPLVIGAVLYARPDFKAASKGLTEEALWLLGPESAREFDALPAAPLRPNSVGLSSGWFVMAADQPCPARLLVDAAAQGADRAGHGHADALSVQLAVQGEEVLVDPGTYVYVSSGDERQQFRGTAMHNTLCVDHRDQAEPEGPFPWRTVPAVTVENWTQGELFELLVANHDGYTRLSRPVFHQRSVLFLKPHFWLVLDRVTGEGTHQLELNWHCAPGAEVELRDGGVLIRSGSSRVVLAPESGHRWSPSTVPSWHSPVYGSRVAAPVVRFSLQTALPAQLATLLLPAGASGEPAGLLRRLEAPADGVCAYAHSLGGANHFFFFAEGPGAWRFGALATDAHFLYYGRSTDGSQRLGFARGSFVSLSGERVVECTRSVARCEWALRDGRRELFFCSEQAAIVEYRLELITELPAALISAPG